jgi:hypothetical protein
VIYPDGAKCPVAVLSKRVPPDTLARARRPG